jgi:hypothetical protein
MKRNDLNHLVGRGASILWRQANISAAFFAWPDSMIQYGTLASFSIVEPSGLTFAQTAGPSKTEDWDGPPGVLERIAAPLSWHDWLQDITSSRPLFAQASRACREALQFFRRCPHSLTSVYYSRLNAIRPNYRVVKLH